MDRREIYICRSRNKDRNIIIIPFIFFLVACSPFSHVSFMVESRSISNPRRKEIEIGSRPPRCLLKCRGCSHCEAVQIPIAPQRSLQKETTTTRGPEHVADSSSRGDYLSNYKPISWKCKCRDFIFDP